MYRHQDKKPSSASTVEKWVCTFAENVEMQTHGKHENESTAAKFTYSKEPIIECVNCVIRSYQKVQMIIKGRMKDREELIILSKTVNLLIID